jgi:hypothetical protein
MLRCCDHVMSSGRNVLDCKGGGQEKWSIGLQEALPTDHNGDVPNGYARRARTPLRWWCDRIPILAIHPDQNPDFSDPSRSWSRF